MGRRKARDVSFKYVYATLYGNCEMEDTLESIITVSEEDMKALDDEEKEYFDSVIVRYIWTWKRNRWYDTCEIKKLEHWKNI